MMLFEMSKKELSYEDFQNPKSCYRGTPFWSWNTLITKDMIEKQIFQFKEMGMGGFHIHVRVGLKNHYLGDEFLELVRYCNEKAKEHGLLCWLYDEDRYSSGIAGGEVTKNVFHRARWLKLTVHKDDDMLNSFDEFLAAQKENKKVKGCFLYTYDIVLEEGYLARASIIDPMEKGEGVKWYLYIELAKESSWCNNQTYVDTLKDEAIGSFIDITHKKYAEVLGENFGESIPAIFTDEPHINGLRLMKKAESFEDVFLPYTEALPKRYGVVEGKDFFEAIPYLVWNRREDTPCSQKYHYYDTLSQMFSDAYCKQIGDWCKEHNLLSTGHILGEESLQGQTSTVGEAMRCYKEFHIPGIDNLCDFREFSAVKQATSVAHQCGREGVLSELYGVTQWDFDFKGYKLAGDWQAALGISIRVPHLAWASMNGEAKRDYPAAIGWQSPWYKDYSYIENHFARINYCLTRGEPVVHVGVVHPIESSWLLQGPKSQTSSKQKQLEEDFQNLTKYLLTGGIDFDYIAESSLEVKKPLEEHGKFCCGNMQYDVVLVPSCINLRKTTLEKLCRFSDAGGCVIFVGDSPGYVDCKVNNKLDEFIKNCKSVRLSRNQILEYLDEWRDIDILDQSGIRTSNLLYQMRQDYDCRWLFIAQAYNGIESRQTSTWNRRALHAAQELDIKIKGHWIVEKYDTLTGQVSIVNGVYCDEFTTIPYSLYGDDSLLLRLSPSNESYSDAINKSKRENHNNEFAIKNRYVLAEPYEYRMDEPNVLLLDCFEYALDEENYNSTCEVLKIDNLLRGRLQLPLRCEALAQPYIRVKEDVREHKLHLRTTIHSTAELYDCYLALEEAEYFYCTLNGEVVDMSPWGHYVDSAINMVKLPVIHKGENQLCLSMDYGDSTDLEWMYLLGEFGVSLQGAHATLYPKPEKLFWGDYTRQGFPFYTGNMSYYVKLPNQFGEDAGQKVVLQVPYYSGAAVKASTNDGEEQMMAFLPYACELHNLKPIENVVRITCLGNRYNGFGQLHMMGNDMVWLGPDSWRSEGPSWTDTYQVKPMGILSAPILECY